MGWTRFLFLGDFGQQLELNDHDGRLSRLARAHRSGSTRDQEQDAHIQELEKEVMQLGAGLAALVGILNDKGIATGSEIAAVIDRAVREGEQEIAAKAQAKKDAAAAATKQAAVRKLERLRARKR